METKNIAENIDLSGSTSVASLSRTSLVEPIIPTRNAPSASEKLKWYARNDTRKHTPRSVSTSASSSFRDETESRSLGTRTIPNTKTARKKTASHPSEPANAEADIPPPVANPVTTAIAPTQTMSSHNDVPRTYFANGRFPQPISSITFASSVVAESHIATPRKADSTDHHPNTRVPTV